MNNLNNIIMRTKRIYFETEETTIKKKKGWIDIDIDFIKLYMSLTKIIVNLKGMATVKLLCWTFSQVNGENMFSFNKTKIKEFNKYLENNNSEPYNERSVYNALKELVDNNIVIKWSNGSYQLNPNYLWTNGEVERVESIKGLNSTILEESMEIYKKI
jgi:hypothetical protein